MRSVPIVGASSQPCVDSRSTAMTSGPSGSGEPFGERFAERVRGEVLVLDVDGVLRGRDHVEIELPHLA